MIIRDDMGKVEVHMYMPYNDPYTGWERGCDIIHDWLDSSEDEMYVDDIEFCLDNMQDWVERKGDFADEEDAPNNYREVVIDGEIISNWK